MLVMNEKVPNASVGLVQGDAVIPTSMDELFKGKKALLVGFPGVFTPICTQYHMPSLIKNAPKLKERGIEDIYCISDDNFWALDAWAKTIKGSEVLKFISDGNREFLIKSNIKRGGDDNFLGGKYSRFYAFLNDGVVTNMKVEDTVYTTDVTSGDQIAEDIFPKASEL